MEICFSGTLIGYGKKDASTMAVNCGLTVADDLTKRTDFLVSAKLDSAKTKKAVSYGTRVLTQAEFEEFIEAGRFPEPNARYETPTINWTKIEPYRAMIEYADAHGEIKSWHCVVVCQGEIQRQHGTTAYMGVRTIEEDRFLTLREDRVLSLSRD